MSGDIQVVLTIYPFSGLVVKIKIESFSKMNGIVSLLKCFLDTELLFQIFCHHLLDYINFNNAVAYITLILGNWMSFLFMILNLRKLFIFCCCSQNLVNISHL